MAMSLSYLDEEAKRKKMVKWTIGITAFVVFQVAQALFFVLVVMKFKSPKFRIGEFHDVQDLRVEAQAASPSFNMSFAAPVRIKNTNWGPFKYDAAAINFTYGGVQVGQVMVPKSKVNFKSTKKIDASVSLSWGLITLNSQGELKGKVTVMFMFKKKKTSQMSCTMAINTATKAVQSLSCE